MEFKEGEKLLALYLLVLILIMAAEPFYRGPLDDYSLVYIKETQTPDKFDSFFFTFLQTVSYIGGGNTYMMFLIVSFACVDRAKSFYYAMFITSFEIF